MQPGGGWQRPLPGQHDPPPGRVSLRLSSPTQWPPFLVGRAYTLHLAALKVTLLGRGGRKDEMGIGIEKPHGSGRLFDSKLSVWRRVAAAMFLGLEVVNVRWSFASISQDLPVEGPPRTFHSVASLLVHIPKTKFRTLWDHMSIKNCIDWFSESKTFSSLKYWQYKGQSIKSIFALCWPWAQWPPRALC